MARYWYRGLDSQGRAVQGQIAADDRPQAVEELRRQACFVTQIYAQRIIGQSLSGHVPLGDLEPFCRQLSLLLQSGVSLLAALELMSQERLSHMMAKWLEYVLKHIRNGQSLSEAIARSEVRTPPMLAELVAVGEEQGRLGETLLKAADYFEQQRRLRNELLTAMLYPALVVLVILAAVTAMMVFVVPALVQTYDSLNAPLPLLTRGFIALSRFVVHWGAFLLLGTLALAGVLFGASKMLRENPHWQSFWRRAVHTLPAAKRLWAEQYFVQFAQMLGQLLQSGVQVMAALQMVARHYRGLVYRQELAMLIEEALRGQSLTAGLNLCSFVPPAALQMIHVGEESGHLAEMLLHGSAYYSQRMTQRFNRLARIIEPVLIIFLGLLILLIAGSLFLPIISSYRYIG